MLNECVTMREPGLSCLVRIGRSFRFDADSRYVVTTVALLTSVFIASCSLNVDEVLDAGGLGVGVGFGDADGVDVDAEAAGAVFLGGGDRNPAVAAAQIDDEIALLDVGQGQHPVDDVLRRRHIGRQLGASGRFGVWCLVPECQCVPEGQD